jgi:DNA-binding CsgD family transcriptional regulator/PAS domain-containing protein
MDSSLHALIGLIYDAALDPRRWSEFLQAYLDAVRATGAVLIYHDVGGHQGAIATSANIPPEANQKYNEHFVAVDPWLYAAEAKGLLCSGAIVLGDEVVPRSHLARTEYYNDFASGYGISRMMGAVISRDGQAASTISTLRPDSLEPFGESERRVLQAVLPHLRRAREVHYRLAVAERSNAALLDALDHMPVGVIVVQRAGRVVFSNSAASLILEQRDGLTSGASGLEGSTTAVTRALREMVCSAAATSAGKGTHSGGVMALPRPSLRRSLSVMVAPLRAQSVPGLPEQSGLAVVFVTDPEFTLQADTEVLRQLWGLTPTEAAIAVKMASGASIPEIADQLAISGGTVRWHVKHVMAKTDTKRQSNLVRVLMASPAVLRR